MPPTDPIEGHVGAMIGEATRLHKEALTYLDKPKADPLPQLREAARLLNEAEVLASDAASYVDATQMEEALAELHRQQGEVRAMIAQVERSSRTTNVSAAWWPIAILSFLIFLTIMWI